MAQRKAEEGLKFDMNCAMESVFLVRIMGVKEKKISS
jgi:hypothetical protein